ncbi:hypothetical protein [Mesorhizobium sp. M0243]|uniref:hypothetical protein n=1 Tax=Mesorhizobium sp. M0243 TaxID=2956925 RepID=UPI0033365E60
MNDLGPHFVHPGEFGYYEIVATEVGKAYFPERLHVAEAHYHQFEIPAGADLLAKGELFEHQAFRYGEKAFGFRGKSLRVSPMAARPGKIR